MNGKNEVQKVDELAAISIESIKDAIAQINALPEVKKVGGKIRIRPTASKKSLAKALREKGELLADLGVKLPEEADELVCKISEHLVDPPVVPSVDDEEDEPVKVDPPKPAEKKTAEKKTAEKKSAKVDPKPVVPVVEKKNGIRRPAGETLCGRVWSICDALAKSGEPVVLKDVREIAEKQNLNPGNAVCEFYQWRKFNSITGRTPKQA